MISRVLWWPQGESVKFKCVILKSCYIHFLTYDIFKCIFKLIMVTKYKFYSIVMLIWHSIACIWNWAMDILIKAASCLGLFLTRKPNIFNFLSDYILKTYIEGKLVASIWIKILVHKSYFIAHTYLKILEHFYHYCTILASWAHTRVNCFFLPLEAQRSNLSLGAGKEYRVAGLNWRIGPFRSL